MGDSLRMRRVPANELERGIAVLEEGFSAILKNDEVYDREIASGTLCSLGEDWRQLNVLLTGEYYPDGIDSLPVLSGVHVATFDSPIDMMIWLDADRVRNAHAYLGDIDFDDRLERHRDKLASYGILWLEPDLRRLLGDMQRFYGLAAAAGEAVAKRVFG